MIKVGLTGGIGSGKSTAAKLFAALGVTVLDADHYAHRLLAPGTPYFQQVIEHFGPAVLQTDGTLNRAHLRQLIFADPTQRLWLEQLLHPPIMQQLLEGMQQASGPYCIAVIPLLVEKDLMRHFDRVVVVDLPEDVQQARVLARDKIAPPLYQAMLQAQCSRAQRLAAATDILSNAGSKAELEQALRALHNRFLTLE